MVLVGAVCGVNLRVPLPSVNIVQDAARHERVLKRIEAKQRCRLGRRLGTIFFRGHAAWIRSRCLPVVLDAVATPAADCRALMRDARTVFSVAVGTGSDEPSDRSLLPVETSSRFELHRDLKRRAVPFVPRAKAGE